MGFLIWFTCKFINLIAIHTVRNGFFFSNKIAWFEKYVESYEIVTTEKYCKKHIVITKKYSIRNLSLFMIIHCCNMSIKRNLNSQSYHSAEFCKDTIRSAFILSHKQTCEKYVKALKIDWLWYCGVHGELAM